MKKKLMMMLATASVLAACGNGAADTSNNESADSSNGEESGETVKVGSLFALSGGVSAYGTPQNNAVHMAVEEINADGGVNGKELEVVEYDYQSNDIEAATLATRLATEDNVSIIIGPDTSGAAIAALGSAQQYGVPLLSPSATLDFFTQEGQDSDGELVDMAWRVAFADAYQGETLANFASTELGATKAAVLGDNASDYAVGLSNTFKKSFAGEVVAEENFTAGETDFSAVLTSLKSKDFDVLFLPGYYEEAGLIIKQAREMGIDAAILGPDGFGNQSLYELAGTENMVDVYYTTQFSSLSEEQHIQDFLTAYEEKYNVPADMFAALAYDATYVAAQSMERAGDFAPEAVNAELSNTKDFPGVTGTFSFDELHNPVKSVTIIEVQNGEDVNVYEVTPE